MYYLPQILNLVRTTLVYCTCSVTFEVCCIGKWMDLEVSSVAELQTVLYASFSRIRREKQVKFESITYSYLEMSDNWLKMNIFSYATNGYSTIFLGVHAVATSRPYTNFHYPSNEILSKIGCTGLWQVEAPSYKVRYC